MQRALAEYLEWRKTRPEAPPAKKAKSTKEHVGRTRTPSAGKMIREKLDKRYADARHARFCKDGDDRALPPSFASYTGTVHIPYLLLVNTESFDALAHGEVEFTPYNPRARHIRSQHMAHKTDAE
eukprot:jgi/Mesvir1/12526/Mv24147-RA.1